jgi:uncharacterized protein (DUF433 family)
MKTSDLFTIDPDVLGGVPVFKGTRVPFKSLFDYLEKDYSLEEFLECFPSITKEMACRASGEAEAKPEWSLAGQVDIDCASSAAR